MKVQVGGEFNYELSDYFDPKKTNIRDLSFNKKLDVGDLFEFDDVVYRVEKIYAPVSSIYGANIRMVRYKIPPTTTQFVHKCPAKKSMINTLDKGDIVKLEEKVGTEKLSRIKGGRVKMRAHNSLEQHCPLCKVIFWKEQTLLPESVAVQKLIGKKSRSAKKKASKGKNK